MINESVAYVLCRTEDDASLTPISQHKDILTGRKEEPGRLYPAAIRTPGAMRLVAHSEVPRWNDRDPQSCVVLTPAVE